MWQEHLAATERLRICIAAKRISFRLFKQIYWQSFDEDIQVGHLPHAPRSCCNFQGPLKCRQLFTPLQLHILSWGPCS